MQVKHLAKLRRSLEIYINIKITTFKFCRKSSGKQTNTNPVHDDAELLYQSSISASLKWRVTCKAQLQYKYIHTFRKAVFINIWNDIVYEVLHEFLNLWSATAGPQAASFSMTMMYGVHSGRCFLTCRCQRNIEQQCATTGLAVLMFCWLADTMISCPFHIFHLKQISGFKVWYVWPGTVKTKCATLIIDDLV